MIVSRTITGSEPVTLNEAKLWLKVDFNTDDALITELISAARKFIEDFTGRSIVAGTVTVEETESLRLPLPTHGQVTNVTLDGVTTTSYYISGQSVKKITFTAAGVYRVTYQTEANTDQAIKTIIKKIVAHHYENRNLETPLPYDVYNHLMQMTV